MYAEVFHAHADRMTPVATIPAHTSQEAIEELEYAACARWLQSGHDPGRMCAAPFRSWPSALPELAPYAGWIDNLVVDSPYDYDPGMGQVRRAQGRRDRPRRWLVGGRTSVTRKYGFNHIGRFAESGNNFAKALVLGGVTKRFPTLNFAFLEKVVLLWASALYAGLVAHYTKRNAKAIADYDPQNVDIAQLAALIAQYGGGVTREKPDPTDRELARYVGGLELGAVTSWRVPHEWDQLELERPEDLRRLFEPNFYFGCEADDSLVAIAFDRRVNPFNSTLNAMFSSDIGHWDVPDMAGVLPEAWELVEHGLLSEAEFTDFMFTNPVSLHAGMNPDFFKGTVVAADVDQLLAAR